MKGLTPLQLVEITEFVQKHHHFGYVHKENQLPGMEYGYCIKYIDACYDSRMGDYWSISFRGMGKINFNTNNCYFKQFDNMHELVMSYLKGGINESDIETYCRKFKD